MNITTFAVNPLATLLIYTILINLTNTSELANLIFIMAIYNTFAILSKLSTWQYVLMELSKFKQPNQVDKLLIKLFVLDFTHFLFCATLLIILFKFDLIYISSVELFFIITTGYFLNNSVVVGLHRYNETFLALFGILIASLILKIIFTIIMSNIAPNHIMSAIIFIDFIIWAPITIRLYIRCKAEIEFRLPKFSEIYHPQKVNFYISSVATIPINQLDKVLLFYMLDESLLSIYAIAQRGNILFSTVIEALNVLFIKLQGGQNKKFGFLELKFTVFSFGIQMTLLLSILSLFNVVDQFAFDNNLQDFKTQIILFYLCYIMCASFFWIHTKAANFLDRVDYFMTILYSILIYYVFLFLLSKLNMISFGYVLISLVVQYIAVIVLRFYYLNLRH